MTVLAREAATGPRRLWLKARAALPFGAHPELGN